MRIVVVLAALVVAACGQLETTPTETGPVIPPELAAAAERYEQAQIAGDAATMADLVADDYVLVGSNGARQTKGQLIDFWTEHEFEPNPVTVTEPVEILWRDGAALGGLVTLTGTQSGVPFTATLRYVDIWALRDGQWQVVYGQTTTVRAPAQ